MSSQQYISGELVSPQSLSSDSTGGGDNGADSGEDWLRIEQVEESEPPTSGFDSWLTQNGFGYNIQTIMERLASYKSPCEEDGVLCIELQVHKSRADLDYTFHATYGELSERFVHTGEIKKSLPVRNAESVTLDNLVIGDVTASWEGPVFGVDGRIEPPPEITIEGSTITFDQLVVIGSLRLSHGEQHDAYTLTITPRETGEYDPEDPKSAYESMVWAVWGDGEIVEHDIRLPEMDGNCDGGSTVIIDSGDGDDETETCYRRTVVVDSCDHTNVISDTKKAIECPEEKEEAAT